MDYEEILLLLIIGASASLLLETPRKWWVKPWLRKRDSKGNLSLVHNEIRIDDPASFLNFLRMDEDLFNILLNNVTPHIKKENTKFRDAISPRDRLTITLRYLATGETYKSLSYSFRVGHSTISKIIPEVCIAIYKTLNQYLKVPNTAAEWLNIAEEFKEKWNMPNVIGALDGKHILIQAPNSEGSAYYNYKGTHSIVLLALADANYKFTYIDVGTNGRICDGGVFRKSTLARALANNILNIPEERQLPGRTRPMPFVMVADAAFPLSKHILKPYPFRNMSREQRIFNYRLSRARRVVENAFGILSNRFRILLGPINLKPEKAKTVVLACVALHNFLRSNSVSTNGAGDEIDRRYTFKYGLSQEGGNRASRYAIENRHEFMEYVNGVGAIPWQNDLA